MRIYVASSWRNERQLEVVKVLRGCGHEVYDFRQPAEGNSGFSWSNVDPQWKDWDAVQFIEGLGHPIAADGFAMDMAALQSCDACVLVLPSGRSSHLEIGWAAGAGKRTAILLDPDRPIEPELMYLMCENIMQNLEQLLKWARIEQGMIESFGAVTESKG